VMISLFENNGIWWVDCHGGWWDSLQGLFIWSLNGDYLQWMRRWPSVSNLKWIWNYTLKFSALCAPLLWCL